MYPTTRERQALDVLGWISEHVKIAPQVERPQQGDIEGDAGRRLAFFGVGDHAGTGADLFADLGHAEQARTPTRPRLCRRAWGQPETGRTALAEIVLAIRMGSLRRGPH